jgi:hypothetical protein
MRWKIGLQVKISSAIEFREVGSIRHSLACGGCPAVVLFYKDFKI